MPSVIKAVALFGVTLCVLAVIGNLATNQQDLEEALELEQEHEALFNADKAWAWNNNKKGYKAWDWYKSVQRDRERTRKKLKSQVGGALDSNVQYTRRHIADFWKHSQQWSQQ